MKRAYAQAIALAAIACALAAVLSGCSLSSSGDVAGVPAAESLNVTGPIRSESLPPPPIPARYRCSGSRSWLPLRWSAVPAGTREIVVAVTWNRVTQFEGAFDAELSDLWILSELDPGLRRLEVGPLPAGATLKAMDRLRCPSRDRESRVQFTVYAVPSGNAEVGEELVTRGMLAGLEEVALAKGVFAGSYGRAAGG